MSPKRETAYRGLKVLASTKSDLQRQISSKGGKAAHESGAAHEFDAVEAKAAGLRSWELYPKSSEYMSKIGSKGGKESGRRRHERALARQSTKDEGAS